MKIAATRSLHCFARKLQKLGVSPKQTNGNYKSDFDRTAQVFQSFLRNASSSLAEPTRPSIAVVIMPWFGSAVPWYSIALAFGLAARGRAVTLVWDDTVFPESSAFLEHQNQVIAEMLDRLSDRFSILRLSRQLPVSFQNHDKAMIGHLTELNFLWLLRGGEPTAAHDGLWGKIEASLTHTLGFVRGLLTHHTFEYILVPGGINASSCLFEWVGRENATRVATYDSGNGWITVCPDGVAAQHFDIPRAFEALSQEPASARARACSQAEQELERRRAGRDAARYQPVAAGTTKLASPQVLIPLNVEWDASALGRHAIFENGMDWLTTTIAFILERSDKTVAVRQHPADRDEPWVARADLEATLRARVGDSPRFRFINAQAAVNTYDFIEAAELVLPFVSTVAIEAAAMGKVVLIAGTPYYSQLGFVHAPHSREEYFELLATALKGGLDCLPGQRERALQCYYLSTLGNCVWTDFNPQPTAYWKWVKRAPAKVFREPAAQDILTAIDENQPIALVRHRRKQSECTASLP